MLPLFYKLKESNYGRFLLFVLTLIVFMPFVTHYYLTKPSVLHESIFTKSFRTRSTLEDSSNTEYRLDELRKNINELEHVKLSLKNELRELESKRHGLLREIQEHSDKIILIDSKATFLNSEVSKRLQELADLKFAKKMVNNCPQLPLIKPPKDIFTQLSQSFQEYPKPSLRVRTNCKLSSCFNFHLCPFGRDFSAHIYQPENQLDIYTILKQMPYAVEVTEPIACIYVVVIVKRYQTSEKLEMFLHGLRFWQGDGHNHIIINFGGASVLKGVNTGRAIIVQTSFRSDVQYRANFDIVIPSLASLITSGAAWENSAPQLPAIRKYILSFEGNYHGKTKKLHNKTNSFISVNDLKALGIEAKDIFIKLSCKVDKKFVAYDDWQLCRTHTSRAEVLKASTFTLIYQSESSEDQTPAIIRFIEALQYGAIPVVVSDNIILPFADIIEWERAAILLHSAQFPQLHFIMRTMVINDLLDMRRQGRFLWETYFSTTETVLQTTIAAIQTRLSLPGTPAKETHFSSVFSESSEPLFYRPDANVLIQNGLNSPTYFQNFTSNNMYAKQRWNSYPGALMLYPSDPFVPILPSSAAFKNSSSNMQPIGKGAGGAGVEFQKALGGDYPFEQFTIVMLTYKRESVLIEALGRLEGLQYLSKVVVVWNSPGDPSPDLKWPNIGVPIKVLRPKMNSLNNRFLPFDEIETDAVLSMDDDIHLRHDEILFGFRVWREARDRIVGFPGRYHAWDINYGGWLYNSNYSCELSMVLTGAAFIHKYYTFLYTHVIPQAIRDKVDEYTNCEDIAMNFLVSHVTRKPPLKVTSRWTFRCPDCTSTLFLDETHFTERHKCINFFVKVFGYMPLLRTQFRADSVLFKTRISSDKTKCFTYI